MTSAEATINQSVQPFVPYGRVAVIGAGISGLSAAWHLERAGADVTLLEKSGRVGGHTHTHEIADVGKSVRIDTGFIVFNTENYPEFSKWLDDLGVGSLTSDVSFAVRDDVTGLEYGTTDLRAVLANKTEMMRPRFLKLWRDLFRFYRAMADGPVPEVTLGAYLAANRYSEAFVHSHLLPICAALWSQPAAKTLDMSLEHVVEFMRNHRMLQVEDRPQWRVVANGSDSYVDAFLSRFQGRVITRCAGIRVSRAADGVHVGWEGHRSEFDAVVIACHSDEALGVLADPTPAEWRALSDIPYQRNRVYLHSDPDLMPRKKAAWSSWNVVRTEDSEYVFTYWMNRLQQLELDRDYFVTLNPQKAPAEVRWAGSYDHPCFTPKSREAQARWADISNHRTAFAGAYWGAGFHEDGFVSGRHCAQLVAGRLARVG